MRLLPAVDILDGNAVRLVRGDYEAKKVYGEDPLEAARAWVQAGAEYLHVVDLDGAKQGEPVNLGHLREIADGVGVPVQYGGGLRTASAIADALAAGAERVVLGTVAFTDPDLLTWALAEHGPGRILVAVDVRGGHVATHGWMHTTDVPARDAFARLRELGAHHFVFTNIDHDGMLDGANRAEVIWVAQAAGEGSVIFSGGIGTLADLHRLAELRREQELWRLSGVIVGTALYEGRFTVADAQAALDG
jgi:phosphoribosylformimino-5-aminoimidazole carboxamide ribotide isomerase